MKHPERVEDYLEHIAQAIQRATEYIDRLGDVNAFSQSQRDQDAVVKAWRRRGRGLRRRYQSTDGPRDSRKATIP